VSRHHPNPTGFGYSTSPNFNEMYAKKMAEMNAAAKKAKPAAKPKARTPKRPKTSTS
jgi:hypothetical protein